MEVKKIPKKTITVIEPKRSIIVDKSQHRQKRVAAYCRVSTGSEEQLTSYTNQKKVYTEMISTRPDWYFAGMYADEGISGTKADKRPEFKKMIFTPLHNVGSLSCNSSCACVQRSKKTSIFLCRPAGMTAFP